MSDRAFKITRDNYKKPEAYVSTLKKAARVTKALVKGTRGDRFCIWKRSGRSWEKLGCLRAGDVRFKRKGQL